MSSELDQQGRTDYDLIRQHFRTHRITDYDVSRFYDPAKDRLTSLFYKSDGSMRESGFDPSNRFGPFSADIIHFNPVCLNYLLYLMEAQTGEIMGILGRSSDAESWNRRAQIRAAKINNLLWDAREGFYFDYDTYIRPAPVPFLNHVLSVVGRHCQPEPGRSSRAQPVPLRTPWRFAD